MSLLHPVIYRRPRRKLASSGVSTSRGASQSRCRKRLKVGVSVKRHLMDRLNRKRRKSHDMKPSQSYGSESNPQQKAYETALRNGLIICSLLRLRMHLSRPISITSSQRFYSALFLTTINRPETMVPHLPRNRAAANR